MRAKNLIESLDSQCKEYQNLDDFEVKGISCNSKEIKDDYIFVAIKGEKQDGNRFINEAVKKGAKVIITQSKATNVSRPIINIPFIAVKDARKALGRLAARFYDNPSLEIKVVGITGTNGKTTTSYLIEALLKDKSANPAVIGTINYRFNNKTVIAKNTTPNSLQLHAILKDMLKDGIDYAITEVSSHALAQDRTEGVNFDSAIFTNFASDHLDYHKTRSNYFKAKLKLFQSLSSESFAVINNDEGCAGEIKKSTKARFITYGINNKADVIAKDIKFDYLGTKLCIVNKNREVRLKTKLLGRHNLYNVLASFTWAQEEGIDISTVKPAIERFSHVPGRLERIDFKGNFSIFVDYAHTEDALKAVVSALRQLYKKRLIIVFGCGGERDKTKRPKMGRIASELSDCVIITNDNPRSEDPKSIIRDIKRGVNKRNFSIIPNRMQAIKKSLSLAAAGDVVLIAGKGHENYQIMKDKTIRFDDREAVRECLRSMNY